MTAVMKVPKMTGALKIEAAALRNIVDSARALDTGPDVDVKPGKGNNVVFSVRSEVGSFAVAVDGSITTPSLRYHVLALSRVVKMGSILDFVIPSQNFRPTLITSENRKCWMMTRI
jgi:hypothetical protein